MATPHEDAADAADSSSSAEEVAGGGAVGDKKARTKKPKPVLVNTSLARGNTEVVRLAIEADPLLTGKYRHDNVKGKGTVHWVVREEDLAEQIGLSKKAHRFARIAGFAALCGKVLFARLLADLPARPEWWPKTWIVPEDPPPAAAFQKGPLIFKPDGAACGDGIALCLCAGDVARQLQITKAERAVVQRYVQAPLLLDGFKFDLRLYLLVLGVGPAARAFCCREGLVRVCSAPYAPADAANRHKANAHLTNYSIAKYEAGFSHADDPGDGSAGSKRALPAVLAHLQRQSGHDAAAVWDRLKALSGAVAGLMAAAAGGDVPAVPRDALLEGFQGVDPAKLERAQHRGFHIVGVDVLLDAAGAPHVLEVNNNPSMGIDSVFPREGPYAVPPPAMTAERARVVGPAEPHVVRSYLRGKPCRCRQHHRPHDHAPCAVDVVAKRAAVAGALAIVQRDRAAGGTTAAMLAEGTAYEPVLG